MPKPRGSAAARDTWTLLLQLLLSEREFLVAGWAASSLTPAQGNLLYLLEPGKPTTMVALAKFLGCHDSNITGLVDRLEARGLVERRNDPADRRVKLIALTDEGAEFRKQALQKIYSASAVDCRVEAGRTAATDGDPAPGERQEARGEDCGCTRSSALARFATRALAGGTAPRAPRRPWPSRSKIAYVTVTPVAFSQSANNDRSMVAAATMFVDRLPVNPSRTSSMHWSAE